VERFLMTESFIRRRFEFGEASEVEVQFYKPAQRDVDYRCDYEIIWPDRKRAFSAFGIDEVQALILALNMVHAELLSSPEGKRGELRWLGSEDLGLPSPLPADGG
jgi:hypothetical protein